jgi:carbon storage regulator CsrA
MLILSRKLDESIVFQGLDIEVMVCAVDWERGRVKLGIKAPRGVTVLRHELLERMDPWVIQKKPEGVAADGMESDPNP